MKVKELNPNHFTVSNPVNLKDKSNCTFVLFYMDWCKYCKFVKPEWEKMAAKITKDMGVVIAQYNCETYPDHLKRIKSTLIASYPTLIVYKDGKPYHNYDGKRTTKDLLKFVLKLCGCKQLKIENGKIKKK